MITADLIFDAALRQVHRRKLGGGPKTTGADELAFVGDLGSGPILLASRVRLRNPQENFLTSSNYRLGDNHVGRAGHWIDLAVVGHCSDADLAIIERLAPAAHDRRVVVRRAGNRR